jgi:hypothetical protein
MELGRKTDPLTGRTETRLPVDPSGRLGIGSARLNDFGSDIINYMKKIKF